MGWGNVAKGVSWWVGVVNETSSGLVWFGVGWVLRGERDVGNSVYEVREEGPWGWKMVLCVSIS
jgi:hypothetical protein